MMRSVLAACLLGAVTAFYLPGEPADGILPVFAQIKGIVSTDYGYQQVKAYLLNLKSQDPVAERIRNTIHQHPDEHLKEAFNAFFAKIPIIAIEPGFDYPTLDTLFGEVKIFLSTDGGVAVARTYMELLESPNEIVQGIVSRLLALDEEGLKNFFAVMFSHVPDLPEEFLTDFYDTRSELDHIGQQLKAILTTSEGIQKVRDHLKNFQTTNPTMILVKTVLSAMSDASLIDLVKEVTKNIDTVPIDPNNPDLLTLVLQGKDLIIQDEGLQYIKQYLNELQTTNFLVVRMKTFLLGMSDEELKEAIKKGAAEFLGGYYALYDVRSELDHVAKQLKAVLTTSEGIQQVRDHLKAFQTTNPTLILVKTVLSAMSDASLIDLVKEVTKNIETVPIDENNPDLLTLVLQAKDLAITDEGVKYVKEYLQNLQTGNFMVVRLKTFVLGMTDAQLKEAITKGAAELLGGYYAMTSYAEDLHYLFTWIKHNLKSEFYFQDLKRYLTNLKSNNVYVQIGLEYFLQMSEKEMKEVLNEFLKNFPEIAIEPGFDYPDLLSLFGKVKTAIISSDGLEQLREYAAKLQSDNYIVQKLQAALLMADDSILTDILVDLFQGI